MHDNVLWLKGETKQRDVSVDVQAAREMRNVARMESHIARISEQEQQAAAQYERNVRAHAARDRDAHRRDKEAQKHQQRAETACYLARPDVIVTSSGVANYLQ